MSDIRRNAPCPCGSGKKYKHCHGRVSAGPSEAELRDLLGRFEAKERIRQSQQGLGRPIISTRFKEHQIVGVGNTVYFSKSWKTFPDFLADYIKKKLDPAWGNAEIAKPFADRHPLMQWYDAYCRYQQSVIEKPGEVQGSPVTGIVACYLGTAYAVYLLDHNVELQTRLINRLKDPGNFQGAYYELMVASILIRAGFELTLEDEADPNTKHCEFAAVSKKTGRRYWVEAKMRSVSGLLGRTAADGGQDGKPLRQLVRHLNKALAKPAADERLIFIDLNTPPVLLQDSKPDWLEPAAARLEQYERNELQAGTAAYVFVTNMSAHRQLEQIPSIAALPVGLGMHDFNRPGVKRVTDAYRAKQRHTDAFNIGEALTKFAVFPATFDGGFASESYGRPTNRVIIGKTYEFAEGLVATVTTATVDEQRKEMLVGATSNDGQSFILKGPISDDELAEYRQAPEAYFGSIIPQGKRTNDPFELFEWLMEVNAQLPREKMLAWFGAARPDRAELEAMSDADLRMAYCEGHVAAILSKSASKNSA